MTKHITHTALLLPTLFSIIFFSSSASATGMGRIDLDQEGLDAREIIVKMNIYRTGGTVTPKGCAENCPTGLSANRKTEFMVHGKTVKRQNIKKYSGRSGYLKHMKANKSVILIDWK